MANFSVQDLPRRHVGQLTPPQNANNQTFNRRFKGHGNPNGQILAYQGDEYLELDTGIEWNKMTDNDGKPSLTGWEAETEAETESVLNLAIRKTTLPTIYATDPAYGAVGDYTGKQNTAGTGTDNGPLIQAALDAAYEQGPAGVNDTVNGVYGTVKVPTGKYLIKARSDGLPAIRVPLKCVLDFSEAELYFEKPPLGDFGHAISEPNPLWCGIIIGNMSGLKIGKMLVKWGEDLTYGGTWFGNTLDAIRVQESDISWIEGGGREHYILGFTRGACIRILASYNVFIRDLNFSSNAFGIVMGYFGTAYTGYPRYRGTSDQENVSTSMFITRCSFLNIFLKAIFVGVNGDYHTPADGGFEDTTFDRAINGGPISITQCAFENIAEESIYCFCQGGVFISDIRLEECGESTSLAQIYADTCRSFSLKNVTMQLGGLRQILKGSYTGALASGGVNPLTFVRVDATNVAPFLENIYINNQASSNCQLVHGGVNVTRLPIVINYRTEVPAQMQRTTTYMQSIILENDGGRTWSVSVTGLTPQETVDGVETTFTFLNGFDRQKPKRIVVDGVEMEATDVAGTNWTWSTLNTNVTFTVAPTKSVRAFF